MKKTIKSREDFEKVFRGGKRLNHRLVRATALRISDNAESRIAIVAAKRLGNAVHRNRCKRVLRAAAYEDGFPPAGYDVILFSTNATHDASSAEVACALGKLAKKLGA